MINVFSLLLVSTLVFSDNLCDGLLSPNVLLFVVDDLRPSINAFGDPFAITPNIDEIARNGIIFTNTFSQQALCGPSRTSFLTSRRPDTTRSVDVHYYWRKHAGNYTTMPQYFKENGYFTQSVGKIFHPGISSNHNDDQPYSWSGEPYHPSSQKYKNLPVCRSKDRKFHSNIYCPVKVEEQPEGTLPDIQSTNFALKWLRKKHEESINLNMDQNKTLAKPFFLAVGFHKPHIPLKFPREFLDLYPFENVPLPSNRFRPEGLPLVAWNPWNDLRRRDDIASLNVSFPFGPIPDIYSKYIRQGYYAATSYTDSLIGPIVALTKLLFPNTIIVFMADHGWSLGEHQEWSKYSNYDVATKVPLIISLPAKNWYSSQNMIERVKETKRTLISPSYFKRIVQRFKMKFNHSRNFTYKKQRRHDGVVELLDIFPTLVDFVGLPKLPKCPKYSFNISLCTEGESLYCVLNKKKNSKGLKTRKIPDCARKIAAYSQFPRPGVFPSVKPDSDQPRLNETKIMGYSVRTNRFRYTSWIKFNHTTFDVDFSKVYGEELYDHKYDDDENTNLIHFRNRLLVRMRKLLKIIFNN